MITFLCVLFFIFGLLGIVGGIVGFFYAPRDNWYGIVMFIVGVLMLCGAVGVAVGVNL